MSKCHSMIRYDEGIHPEEYNCYCPLGNDHDIDDTPEEPPGVDWSKPNLETTYGYQPSPDSEPFG